MSRYTHYVVFTRPGCVCRCGLGYASTDRGEVQTWADQHLHAAAIRGESNCMERDRYTRTAVAS